MAVKQVGFFLIFPAKHLYNQIWIVMQHSHQLTMLMLLSVTAAQVRHIRGISYGWYGLHSIPSVVSMRDGGVVIWVPAQTLSL